MPITAAKVRELVARGEGALVDFKVDMYNFGASGAAGAAANAELAKDMMAKANLIRAGSGPAYILIGVQNDRKIVGVAPEAHVDDASLHEKVKFLLNAIPTFE